MSAGLIGVLGVALLLVLTFARVPIALALAASGLLGYAAIDGWGTALKMLGRVPFTLASAYSLSVIPLFILMGAVAARGNGLRYSWTLDGVAAGTGPRWSWAPGAGEVGRRLVEVTVIGPGGATHHRWAARVRPAAPPRVVGAEPASRALTLTAGDVLRLRFETTPATAAESVETSWTVNGRPAGQNFAAADPLLNKPFEFSDPDFRGRFGSPIFRAGAVQPPDDGFFDQSAVFLGGIGNEDWTEEWTNWLVESDIAP